MVIPMCILRNIIIKKIKRYLQAEKRIGFTSRHVLWNLMG